MSVISKQFFSCIHLTRLHRPIGIFLLLWPTLWALWIAANGVPNIKIVFIFILGTIVMRSAGCVINDYADKDFDRFVTRTKDRPLAAEKIKPNIALGLFVFLIAIAFILVLQLNILTIKLSLVGLLLAIIYPFTKRFFHAPQLFLGAAYAWSVPMAFAAQTNSVPLIAWLIFLIAFLWPIAYDTMYAMADRDDDKKIGIQSTAILLGNYDRLGIAMIQSIVLLLLGCLGYLLKLNSFYFLFLVAAAIFNVYQQHLIRERNPQKCFHAFLNNNWFGLVILIGIVISTH